MIRSLDVDVARRPHPRLHYYIIIINYYYYYYYILLLLYIIIIIYYYYYKLLLYIFFSLFAKLLVFEDKVWMWMWPAARISGLY